MSLTRTCTRSGNRWHLDIGVSVYHLLPGHAPLRINFRIAHGWHFTVRNHGPGHVPDSLIIKHEETTSIPTLTTHNTLQDFRRRGDYSTYFCTSCMLSRASSDEGLYNTSSTETSSTSHCTYIACGAVCAEGIVLVMGVDNRSAMAILVKLYVTGKARREITNGGDIEGGGRRDHRSVHRLLYINVRYNKATRA